MQKEKDQKEAKRLTPFEILEKKKLNMNAKRTKE
jgi:hypothetical protein